MVFYFLNSLLICSSVYCSYSPWCGPLIFSPRISATISLLFFFLPLCPQCKFDHVSLLLLNPPWVPISLKIVFIFLCLKIQNLSRSTSASPLSLFTLTHILQPWNHLFSDVHTLLLLWSFGMPHPHFCFSPGARADQFKARE